MFRKATTFVAAALAFGAATGVAQADSEVEALKQRVAELEKSNAAARAEAGKTFMEGRRADDVRSMVADVLEDSESRRSLSASGAVAGHDGGFFLASADNKFRMEISGKLVFRYYMNFREGVTATAGGSGTTATAGNHDFQHGFVAAEVEIGFEGHVFNEDIGYGIVFESSAGGNWAPDSYYISYSGITDGLTILIGYGTEVDYDLENATSSTRQNAVARSYTAGRLNLDGGDGNTGLTISYDHDMFRVAASFQNMDSTTFSNNSGYVLNARVEVKLMGTWKQYKDLSSWGGEDVMLVIGGGFAAAYSADGASYRGDGTDADSDWFEFGWAIDARFEWNGVSIWISALGQHGQTTGAGSSFDIYGVIGTVAYNIMDTVEVFVRAEGVINSNQYDGRGFTRWDRDGGVAIITVGGTWFFYKDKLKLTADVGFATDNINDSGAGFLDSDNSDPDNDLQVLFRVQVQLKF